MEETTMDTTKAPAQTRETWTAQQFSQEDLAKLSAKSWPSRQKWMVMSIVAWMSFVSPLSSTMIAPAAVQVSTEFRFDSAVLRTFITSLFLFGYVIGSLIAAPLSDLYGRKPVLDISFFMFTIWNIAAAAAPNVESLLVFRFLAGLGASSSLSVGGGVISDCFSERERGGAVAVFALGPVLGPVIGPLTGGYLADALGWRWVFWFLSIITGVTSFLQIAFNRESNPDILVRRSASLGRDSIIGRALHAMDWTTSDSKYDHHSRSLLTAVALPWKMIFNTPIVSLLCLYAAFVYGLLYLLLTTITQVFVEVYGWSLGKSGLAYLGLGVGFLLGVAIVGGTANRLVVKAAQKNNGILIPEKRLLPCIWFSFLIPVSFFWYGFTAAHDTHWALPICGLAPFAIGMIGVFLPIQTYLIDAAPKYGACSTAALASSRNVVGTFLPLLGPHLYKTLGVDWGNFTLGCIAVLLIPIPALIYRYGAALRKKTPWMVDVEQT